MTITAGTWSKRENDRSGTNTDMASTLSALNLIARSFSETAHLELNVIYKNLMNGPEIIFTKHRGERTA